MIEHYISSEHQKVVDQLLSKERLNELDLIAITSKMLGYEIKINSMSFDLLSKGKVVVVYIDIKLSRFSFLTLSTHLFSNGTVNCTLTIYGEIETGQDIEMDDVDFGIAINKAKEVINQYEEYSESRAN